MSETEPISATGPSPFPVAVVGADFPGLRLRIEAPEGTTVRLGQTLFRDRKHPDIAFVSPIAGRVASITYAPRRMLGAVIVDPDPAMPADPVRITPDRSTGAGARQTLLAAGLWPAFVARPFGGMPDPEVRPDAIFVTATPAAPDAPDPRLVLEGREAGFIEGLEILTMLTEGTVHLCQGSGRAQVQRLPDRVRITSFGSGPGAGLPGTHVHRLYPVGEDRLVWTVGYQDVIAIGHLFATGLFDPLRTVAISGPGAGAPKLVRLPLGVDLQRAARAPDMQGPLRFRTGAAPFGREAAYLGRHHDTIVIVAQKTPETRNRTPSLRPLFALAGLERALPLDILPVPMMRALRIGDTEAARRLGCLELLEDDVAALSAQCTSGVDYGLHLRAILDDLRKQIG